MKLLLVYGTTEGQTQKVAGFVADQLAKLGHQAKVVNAIEKIAATVDPRDFDAAIIAASLHAGHYQSAIIHFVSKNLAAINEHPNAFLSVSLAAAGEDEDDMLGLKQCLAKFTQQTGWTPRLTHHVAGAFRYTSYDFLKRWAMKYIAYRKGGPTDTSRDYELTDWEDLARFVSNFAQAPPGAQ
ncbi:MAG TPA: flavodoxin domain-containing protein [Steroidobacteraceae bacterium]|nr:flavodoxin domain-containing protein [Steroidobacteraceae bacterium]